MLLVWKRQICLLYQHLVLKWWSKFMDMWLSLSISSRITNGKCMNPLNYLVSGKAKGLLHQPWNTSSGNPGNNCSELCFLVLLWTSLWCTVPSRSWNLGVGAWRLCPNPSLPGRLQTWLCAKLTQLFLLSWSNIITNVFTSSFLTEKQSVLCRVKIL